MRDAIPSAARNLCSILARSPPTFGFTSAPFASVMTVPDSTAVFHFHFSIFTFLLAAALKSHNFIFRWNLHVMLRRGRMRFRRLPCFTLPLHFE